MTCSVQFSQDHFRTTAISPFERASEFRTSPAQSAASSTGHSIKQSSVMRFAASATLGAFFGRSRQPGRAPEFNRCGELSLIESRSFRPRSLRLKAPDAPCGLEKTRRGQSASRLTDHQRCDQWTGRAGILFDQLLETDRKLLDRIGRREVQSFRESLIPDG